MALRFNIENETNLPDGGPVSFTVTGKRIVDIGRDRHLDWTLPDPARLISGKHCEVHYRDGGYWLHDVSTNGTFLNGADQRMRGPHRLRSGDRFVVGHYIIGVALDSALYARFFGSGQVGAADHATSPFGGEEPGCGTESQWACGFLQGLGVWLRKNTRPPRGRFQTKFALVD